MAAEAVELDKDAFMRLVTQDKLQVEGPSGGYLYTGRQGKNGWELYKTPGGMWDQIKVSTGVTVDPAVNTAISLTVPAGKRWLFLGGEAFFTSDATAHTHTARITFARDGTNIDLTFGSTVTQAQSLVYGYDFSPGGPQSTATSAAMVVVGIQHHGVECPAGTVISVAANGSAGNDDWSTMRYAYKEAPA
jgi:hypothetical protein